MKPALVTGATGFLGWHVARCLLESGHRVRVLARPGSAVRELDAEVVRGDLRDPASVRSAVSGCGVVFHVAADYRLWAPDPRELYRTNVDGTRNVMAAARACAVERVVYTSTVGVIGIPASGIGDEDTPVRLRDMVGHYKRSKFLAEVVVRQEALAGLPVVIVNPTAPIGDHDFKPTPTGRIVLDFLRGAMPAYVDTGLNFVDVRDVAKGHLLALERGRDGERYILGSENLTLEEFFRKLAAVSGLAAPRRRIPYWAAFVAALASTGWARLSGRPPRAPLEGVLMARKKMFASSEKARRELGYRPRPIEGALRRAVEWFREHGYC
ncbi:MAG: NAD-dependent epimerase/dehydratase family protein [Bryobacterales bacterium]|nr:NAD-dependent epimerase/dehydratase family protein [Bryobacteraceae bacterium]MDW8130517.1 NAD-dependent epimerase/dehydratase family protein [Bryobacterales bacterium]